MSQARLLKLVDLAVVLFLAVTAVWQLRQMPASTLQEGLAVHAVLIAAFTLPLLLRARHPVAVFITVAAASWLQLQLGGGLGQPFFAFVVALYSVGAHAATASALIGPAAVLAQVIFVDLPRLRDGDRVDEVIPTWFILFGVWAFGRWMRHRRAEAVALIERAEAAERDPGSQRGPCGGTGTHADRSGAARPCRTQYGGDRPSGAGCTTSPGP